MSGDQRLRDALRRLRNLSAPRTDPRPEGARPLKVEPTSAFELAVSERLAHLQRDVDRLQNRVNWLLGLIASFAVVNLVLNLLQ